MKQVQLKSSVVAVPATQQALAMGSLFLVSFSLHELPKAIRVVFSRALFVLALFLLLAIPFFDQSDRVRAAFVNPGSGPGSFGLVNNEPNPEESGCRQTDDPFSDGPTPQSPSRDKKERIPWLNSALPPSSQTHGMGGADSGIGIRSLDHTPASLPIGFSMASPRLVAWLLRNRDLVLPSLQVSGIFRPPRRTG
jgi:hypothetical protein